MKSREFFRLRGRKFQNKIPRCPLADLVSRNGAKGRENETLQIIALFVLINRSHRLQTPKRAAFSAGFSIPAATLKPITGINN